jgi:hypothetical protein
VSQEPIVTLPSDVSSDDDEVEDLEEQWETTARGRRGPKSIKITPIKVSRRQCIGTFLCRPANSAVYLSSGPIEYCKMKLVNKF